MPVLPITYFSSPQLRQVSTPPPATAAATLPQLILNLGETMTAAHGIGLAAPQVGVPWRVIVVATQDGILGLVDPVVAHASRRQETGEEGCLSIPGVFGLVARAYRIKVSARSPTGEPVQFSAEGLFARVLQHEVDHLNGILFIDRVLRLTAGAERLRELWQPSGD